MFGAHFDFTSKDVKNYIASKLVNIWDYSPEKKKEYLSEYYHIGEDHAAEGK